MIQRCLPLFCCGFLCGQTLVLAGGGAEGDLGVTGTWSYDLYSALFQEGDVQGDGRFVVVILGSDPAPSNFLASTFSWLGSELGLTVQAYDLAVTSQTQANSATVADQIAAADAVFIRGGDQGEYYDLWNDTALEGAILQVFQAGGAIGGTSAGAMSLAEFAFAGGRDLISADVLFDSQTSYLDDEDGGSGIHADFLGLVPGVIVDTHFTWRGRLGRLAGILAKAGQDSGRSDLIGLGIEEKTGLVLHNGHVQVLGHGAVLLLRQTALTRTIRPAGKPLVFTHLQADRLVDGWHGTWPEGPFDSANAEAVPAFSPSAANAGALSWDGRVEADGQKFEFRASWDPFSLQPTGSQPTLLASVGFCHAGGQVHRGTKQEALFHALYSDPDLLGFLLFYDGFLERTAEQADLVYFSGARGGLVLDGSGCQKRGLAKRFSSQNGVPHTAALIGLRLHVLGDAASYGLFLDTRLRALGLEASPRGLTLLIAHWLETGTLWDLDGNARADVLDLALLLSSFPAP
jgi:cyanophycinase